MAKISQKISNMFRKIFTIIFISSLVFNFIPQKTYSADNLVKLKNSSAVYYIDENNLRHVFPNSITYQSWFGKDFSAVQIVSEKYLYDFPLGKNITLKSGKYLVKVPSLPEVYAVEPGGTLRHLKNEIVAEQIYGLKWYEKVIDLPEVFFENYVIGEPINYDYQIPDGVVYKLKNKNDYYYKIAGHVKKFNSFNDVLVNGYDSNDIIEGITTFLLHGREIKGKDVAINNLITENNLAKHDCENKNLKGAFVFVYDGNYTSDELEKIQNIKNNFPAYFSWTTDELSQIELEDEIFKIEKQDYYTFKGNFSLNQVAYDFYDKNNDKYDFLFVFDNFSHSSKTIAEYNYATNSVKGINKPLLKAEVQYGSLGKLKGVINAFNINNYYENGLELILNNLVHEMLHQWSGTLVFLNNEVESVFSLLEEDKVHWSNYVNFISPLGGLGWQDNSDGTFTQIFSNYKIKLSNLDLYTLGLLPLRGIGEIFYLIPENDLITDTISARKVSVDPQKLVDLMGKWECTVSK